MNKYQREYACNRVRETFVTKLSELKDHYIVNKAFPSREEQIQLIEQGKVSVKKNLSTAIRRYSSMVELRDIFDFSEFSTEGSTDPILESKIQELVSARDTALDEIMLGDEESAKQKIADFSDTNYITK